MQTLFDNLHYSYLLSELRDIVAVVDVTASGVASDASPFVPSVVDLINLFQKVRPPRHLLPSFRASLHLFKRTLRWADCCLSRPFCAALFHLLYVFVQPLIAEKANQEHHSGEDVCLMLQLLARMLSVPSPRVQVCKHSYPLHI